MAVNADFQNGSIEKNAFKVLLKLSYSIRDEGTN